MKIRLNVKHFQILLFGLLLATLCIIPVWAESSPQATAGEISASLDTPEISPIEQDIDQTRQYIQALSQNLVIATGDDRDALQLQLFLKNEELRALLAQAVASKTIDDQKLLKLITTQQQYTEDAYLYIESRVSALNKEINENSSESRLSLINLYGDLQSYLSAALNSAWENIGWLQTMDQPVSNAERILTDRVNQRLQLLSASIEYLKQQLNVLNTQIATSPESEKSALQLSQIVTEQRLKIITESLRSTYKLADKMGLPTSEYKRQLFGVTGSITQDILDGEVALSIVKHWSDSLWNWILENAPQSLFKILIFIIILLSAKGLSKITQITVKRAVANKSIKISQLMKDFFVSMSGKVVWIIGILVGLSQLGVDLAPVLTGFGIAGVIIGFALQDTLSNFAAGMMLLIYRPFDVGDFVSAGGVEGKVSHMSLVNTTIRTFDNQIIIVPNSKIWGDVIKNVTHERIRRVDMVFGIGYKDDLLKAESVLTEIVKAHPAVLRSPEPMIKVHVLNTSSVDFIVRPWVKTDDYWDVYWDVTKEVKLRFDLEGISIPFPQQDVHLYTESAENG
ncbi:mechanosensitive ion channel family protein [Grimontia hollisae]|uniref:Small-conductance mechanosensitive channel n=2 Tax=Grimontia hollisae TaxID=673 RepID=D0I6H4_GRIHO|nr:mechanosensitive ion channel family protein [Grimontia hollisae]AMG31566.1 mechanosensitive ion channel family protein [Grimontia hollisae]EEY72243.1 small-conductance mechanosensitive channel [Grimontia hollisae CIP 101886]MDF2185936.1 mechanosensitive ion channel family protein [Grimontia hollisae]STO45332.1 Small-conductance mechanosensitive channel [Grimontia hollisae]STO57846.1 Small-conductance mechanosensitive channel [Grimontia hollisae]